MTRTHYEILQVAPDASRAEIRVAYRSACLRTHPDKARPEDKKKAEYEFRQVQQAYEVLSDDEKRKEYDYQRAHPGADRTFQYQTAGDRRQAPSPFFQDHFGASGPWGRGQDPFSHPFFNRPSFGSFGWPFGGRDPFADMMESHYRMADNLSRMADDLSRMAAHFHSATNPFPPPPWQHRAAAPPENNHNNGEGNFPRHRNWSQSRGFGSPSGSGNNSPAGNHPNENSAWSWSWSGGFGSSNNNEQHGPRWVSESRSETWVNGQRQTTHKRRDADGTVHVTHTYPDGTTRYLVNGVEQPLPSEERRAIDNPHEQQQQQQQQQPPPTRSDRHSSRTH